MENIMPDQNFLAPVNFAFAIKRLPFVSYFVQETNIPGMTIGNAEMPTPFKTIYYPGDKVDFNELQLTVRVDENMQNYIEIYNWIIGMTFPDRFEQYANLIDGDGVFSDATLIIKTNKKNPNITFTFKDMYPTSISDIQMSASESDINYTTATMTFRHNGFDIST